MVKKNPEAATESTVFMTSSPPSLSSLDQEKMASSSSSSSIDSQLAEEFTPPPQVDQLRSKMAAFASGHASSGRRVVLITSGGTKVPLESRTVRFLDNFSSGRRGAASAEHFLASGYAVVFLHRQRSLFPYARAFSAVNLLDALTFSKTGEEEDKDVFICLLF